MNARRSLLVFCLAILFVGAGCQPPGKPTSADVELKPAEVRDFSALYAQNCAGCHGRDGSGSGALALANPVYLAIASDDVIRGATASGIRGSLMPAFAKSAGGTLTDAQIDILVHGMRGRWAKPQEVLGATLPAYAATVPGDATRGAAAYAIFCAHSHGTDGTNARSSIVDGSFLSLVSDQDLRTTIIAGRPDLGHPDWRHDAPGRVMTDEEVTDVVAWLVAQRKANPGQPYAMNAIKSGVQESLGRDASPRRLEGRTPLNPLLVLSQASLVSDSDASARRPYLRKDFYREAKKPIRKQ